MTRLHCRPLLLLTFILTLGGTGQWIFSHQALTRMNRVLLELSTRGLGRVLEHAHRLHDDLIPQEAIQGLSQSAGVHFACLVDRDNKILAHTDPSRIGTPFKKARSSRGRRILWIQPLGDARDPWGRLVLCLSGRAQRLNMLQQAWLLVLFNAGLLFGFARFLQRGESASRRAIQASAELHFRCQELTHQLEQGRTSREASDLRWGFWMRGALEMAPGAVLLLDGAQRLVACNRAARRFLNTPGEDGSTGRSWQDLPLLAECGDALQQSVDHPGQEIEGVWKDRKVRFFSDASPVGGSTWVTFHSTPLA